MISNTTIPVTYIKNKSAIILNTNNNFVYEVLIFCRFSNYFGLMDRVYYNADKEITGVVSNFYKDKHTEIVCELLSAPLFWLLENGYTLYVKPVKTTTKKKESNVKKIKTIK